MESIINFLKIEDPFGGGHGGGGHRSSCTSNNNSGKGGGNDKKKSSMRNGSGTNRSSRRRGSANIRRSTTSGTTGSTSICDSNTSGSSSLAASITSSFKLGLGDSADKLSKLLVSVYDLSWYGLFLFLSIQTLYAYSFIHTLYKSHIYTPRLILHIVKLIQPKSQRRH